MVRIVITLRKDKTILLQTKIGHLPNMGDALHIKGVVYFVREKIFNFDENYILLIVNEE